MEFLLRHKRGFILGMVALCMTFIVITIQTQYRPTLLEDLLGYVVTPAQKATTNMMNWFSGQFGAVSDIDQLQIDNERLTLEVERLTSENKRLKLIEAETEELRALLKIDEKYPDYPKIGAKTIAFDTNNWFDTFTIDKGRNDGFTENMVVLTTGGLVGKIMKSRATYSEVISLIDETSSVSAKVLRTEEIGMVKGDMNLLKEGLCKMEQISIDAEIMENDEIVTSGLGTIYPAGITIGYVKEVKTDSRGLTKYAIIQPVVDFKRIESVLIINESFSNQEDRKELLKISEE